MGPLILVFGAFFFLVFIRVPVAIALALSGLVGMFLTGIDPMNVVLQLYRGLDSFPILAVPFFLTIGILSSYTSIGDRLLRLSDLLVGRVKGGIGHINVVVSMIFAGISGAATAEASAIGSVMIPMMIKRGYSPEYSAAITGISSLMGPIIPPSVLMIIYGAYCNVTIAGLFLGGAVPGIFMGVSYMIIHYIYTAKYHNSGRKIWTDGKNQGVITPLVEMANDRILVEAQGKDVRGISPKAPWRIICEAFPSLLVPIIIILGVTAGIVTATESGLIALVYLLTLSGIVYRDITFGQLFEVLRKSVSFYSIVLLAGGAATIFGWVITLLGAANAIQSAIDSLSLPAFGYLLVIIFILLIIGTFLDPLPAIIIFAPIFLPGALKLGIHPIHLGVTVVMSLVFGMVTPPYGLVLLIVAKLADSSMIRVGISMIPFAIVTVLIIILVAAVPEIVLWLPRLFFPELF